MFETVASAVLTGPLYFRAPDQAGWVRASLVLPGSQVTANNPSCDPNGQAISTCAYDQAVIADLTDLRRRSRMN